MAANLRRCAGERLALLKSQKLPRSLEPVIIFGLKGLVLRSLHLIDCLPQVLGDMELVVHEFRARGLVRHSVGVGREHVGSHGHNLLPPLDRLRLEDGLRGGPGSLRSDVPDAGAVDIGEPTAARSSSRHGPGSGTAAAGRPTPS